MSTFHFTRKRFVAVVFCTLFVVTVAGWIFTGYLVGMATRIVERELENANTVISINLTSELKRIESAAIAVAGSPLTFPVLQANTPENMEKVNNILDRYHKALDAAACYLIDRNGLTLTSSNRNAADSFVGQNYLFRPYFQQAIKGGIGHYFAFGTVSKKRGFFASAPVRDKTGQIIGVVTIKKELEDIEIKLNQYSWFLVDQNGVIFLSSQPEARLKSLWPLSDEQRQKIILSKQYGPGPFEPVLQKQLKAGEEVTFKGKQFLTSQHATPYENISVILLWPTQQIGMFRSFGIILTLLAILLTIGFLTAIYIFKQSNYRMEGLLKESQTQALALADSESQLLARTDELESQKAELLQARKVAEAESARSNTLFNTSTSAHVIINSSAQIVDCNDTFLHLLGYASLENVAGKHPAALSPLLQPDGRNSMEMGNEMVGIAIERGRHSFDWVCQNTRGESILVEVTIIPVMLNGEPHLMGIWHDLTERKQMEQKIIAEGERLKTILDTAPISIAFSTKGKILFANPLFIETFGAKIGDASPQLYVNPEERDTLVERLKRDGIIKNFEIQMFNSHNQVRDILITYMPINYEGEDGILGWLRDITERKQSEKEMNKRVEELERFSRLTINREKMMIQLKEEINTLLVQAGQEKKYKIVEASQTNS